MSVQPVPTIRAAHLSPYIEFLQDKGAQIERTLESAQLPTTVGENPDAHIPLVPALRFLSLAQKKYGLQDLGFLAHSRIELGLLTRSTMRLLLSAPTLDKSLDLFMDCLAAECSVMEGTTSNARGEIAAIGVNFCLSVDEEEMRTMQVHFMLLILAIIRLFAGPGWRPHVLAFQSCVPLSPVVEHYFPNTRFLFGQSHAWIGLPATMLRSERHRSVTPLLCKRVLEIEPDLSPSDFAESLKRVLKSYLGDGYPSIELAADISRTSIRTLQRNLAQYGITYSKLVDLARYEAAATLLRDPNIKIIEIAYAVGYDDPSHFSRAFRRIAGTSPREYRVNLAA